MRTRMTSLVVLLLVLVFAVAMAAAQTNGTTTTQSTQTTTQTNPNAGAATTPNTANENANTGAAANDQGTAGQTGNQTHAHKGKLPQTATPLPLLAVLGLGSLAAGVVRKKRK